MPWPQAGADSKHPGLAGGGPRLAARGGLLMRGYPSCKVCLALGAAAPPPQPELRAVTKAAVTYPLSTQWAGPFRRPSTHQRLICPGCRRRRSRIFQRRRWRHIPVGAWGLRRHVAVAVSWPLLVAASRVRFACPIFVSASRARFLCPLLVSASRVRLSGPLLVHTSRALLSCPPLVSASRVRFRVRFLRPLASRVHFACPLLGSASRVRFACPLLASASRARFSCPLTVSALGSAPRVRLSCPLVVSASRARS